jgi:hypothetical protein
MKHKALDERHFDECHERWVKRSHRDLTNPQPDEWLSTQCLTCAYYIPLVGKFSEDYGVCSNARSPSDGIVMFEHDGCELHAEADDFLRFSISYVGRPSLC